VLLPEGLGTSVGPAVGQHAGTPAHGHRVGGREAQHVDVCRSDRSSAISEAPTPSTTRAVGEPSAPNQCSPSRTRSSSTLSLPDARRIIEAWRQDYNTVRPHTVLGYLTPAEFEQPSPNGEWETQPAEQEAWCLTPPTRASLGAPEAP
jgi:Integrase core domain